MPAKRHWTAADDDHIRAGRDARRPWDGIATGLGASRSAVIERARRLGLPRLAALPAEPEPDANREPLPAGHPDAWALLTGGTLLDGAAYPWPPLA